MTRPQACILTQNKSRAVSSDLDTPISGLVRIANKRMMYTT
ncbi:MAG: hypothetical protein WA395_07195 [Nitrososphaeraceae archaeon]